MARRQLTILFADLAGYTRLSERIDPETLSDIQKSYQAIALEAVERFGGFVASFGGDGVMAYFGHPTAHENDAERAARAGLEIAARVPLEIPLPAGAGQARLSVRVGLHTGLVVLRPDMLGGGRTEPGAVGMAINLAARLQADAPPDSVVASAATIALIEGLFYTEALGSWSIRGLSVPVEVHRIRASRPASLRREARMLRGAGRMIDRLVPLKQLHAEWDAACAGACRIADIVGDAGMGKTRLAQELCDRLDLNPVHVIQATCLEIFAATPLYPASGLLWLSIGLDHRADDGERRAHVAAFLQERGLGGAAPVAAVCDLLGLAPGPDAVAVAPVERRRQQFGVIIALIEQVARAGPTVLWLDDVHWMDPSSVELTHALVKRLKDLPLLVVMTRRPTPDRTDLPPVDARIDLRQLDPGEAVELAESVPGAATLPATAFARAIEVAEGVPLFIEQLIFSLLGQHDEGRGTAVHVPLSLTEMMSARLDRLEGGREVADAAACVGRAFDTPFLASVLDAPEAEVQVRVDQLVATEILRQSTDGTDKQYSFSHALLHRVAYDSTMLADRRRTHLRIAGLLRQPGGPGLRPPEVRAYHLSQAGETAEAIEAWIEAGTQAARRSAHLEALEHFGAGLGLLDQLPDPAARDAFELRLHAGRLAPLAATGGAASVAMDACCRRGLELAMPQEASPLVLVFLYGQCTVLQWRGNNAEALTLARLFAELAERRGHGLGLVTAHRLIGLALFSRGETDAARVAVERSLSLYRPERDAQGTHMFGHNAHIQSSAALGLMLFCLGDVDRGFALGLDAIREADALRHPHSTAIALGYFIWQLGLSGARERLLREARRLIRISEQHHLGVFKHIGEAALGWALCQSGALDQGIAILQDALARLEAAGFRNPLGGYCAILAEAHGRRGDLARARTLSDAATGATANQWLEPEIARVAAGLLPPDQARIGLAQAAARARRSASPVLELRCLRDLLEAGAERAPLEARIAELSAYADLTGRLDRLATRV